MWRRRWTSGRAGCGVRDRFDAGAEGTGLGAAGVVRGRLSEVVDWVEKYWEEIKAMPLEYLHKA